MIRNVLALATLLACLFLLWIAALAGTSRISSAYAANARRLDGSDYAVRLAPNDPHAHLIRAALLKTNNRIDEALKEYQQAVSLRPRDYVLWLELGLAHDEAGQQDLAINALNEAVVRAPDYAGPRWHLGNVLLRSGRTDEAFAELRRAARSNPVFLPPLIDLAWSIYGGNVSKIEEVVQPQDSTARLVLVRFAAKRGRAVDAARIMRTIENVPPDERRGLLSDLLAARQFKSAYEIWSTTPGRGELSPGVTDGGFEQQIKLDDPGFGWQVPRNLQSVRITLDQVERHGGTNSLKLDWNGASEPGTEVLSQIVMVEPNTRYRLRFSARTEDLVTGGLPLVIVRDAGGPNTSQLAQSEALTPKTSSWKDGSIEFATGPEVQAVMVVLRRQNCSSGPCPIFGRVWLDDFVLEKM